MRQPWVSYKSRLTSTDVNAHFESVNVLTSVEVSIHLVRSQG